LYSQFGIGLNKYIIDTYGFQQEEQKKLNGVQEFLGVLYMFFVFFFFGVLDPMAAVAFKPIPDNVQRMFIYFTLPIMYEEWHIYKTTILSFFDKNSINRRLLFHHMVGKILGLVANFFFVNWLFLVIPIPSFITVMLAFLLVYFVAFIYLYIVSKIKPF